MAIVIIYFIICLAIGFLLTTKMQSVKDFYIAGANLGYFMVAVSAMATAMSAWGFVGGPGMAYTSGFSPGILIESFAIIGYTLMFFLVAAPLRKLVDTHGILTIPDALRVRYKSETVAQISSIGIMLGVFPYLMAQYMALAFIIQSVFGWSFVTCMLIGVAVTLIYCCTGGLAASIYTDTLQGIIMVIGAVAIFIQGLRMGGGFTNIMTTLSANIPHFLDIIKPGFEGSSSYFSIISWFLMFTLGCSAVPHVIIRFMALRERDMLKKGIIVIVVTYTLAVLANYSGLWMKYFEVIGVAPALAVADTAGPEFIKVAFGPVFAGILAAVLLAAIMSTVDSFLITASSTVVQDIYQKIMDKKGITSTEEQKVKVARIGMIICGVIPVFFVTKPPAMILWLSASAWGIFVATLFAPLVIGLRWKRATSQGAVAASLAGLVISVILVLIKEGFGIHTIIEPGAWGMIAAVLTFIVVSLLTTPNEANP